MVAMPTKSREFACRIAPGARWLVVILAVLFAALVAHGESEAATGYDAEELRFLRLINEYRANNGVAPLILSDTLAVPAERHSEDMAGYDFFAHNTERSSYYPAGSEPWDRMAAEGYDYNTFKGENLAVGCETAAGCFDLWRDSPAHNAAMLDANYKVMGVARLNVPDSRHGWYWTTDFGGRVDPSSHAPGEDAKPTGPQGTPNGGTEKPTARPAGKPDADSGAIENGGMDDGPGWKERAADGADLLLDGRARLGGYDDGGDDLRQKIRVGRDTRLSYKLRVEDAGGRRPTSDHMAVRILGENGRPLDVPRRYTEADAGAWARHGVDLSRFAGRTVYLSFHAKTDATAPTAFYVDDVALKAR